MSDEHESWHDQLSQLFDRAPVAYFVLDRNGTIRTANARAALVLGAECPVLIGRSFLSFVPDAAHHEFLDHLCRCLDTPSRETMRLTVRTKDGSLRGYRVESEAQAGPSARNLALVALLDAPGASATPVSVGHREDPVRTVQPATGPGRILVAEDNELNAIVLQAILKRAGYEVVRAHDGREALALLTETPCDLILMDLSMPDLDGIGATRAIRNGELAGLDRNTPILAITAYAVEETGRSLFDAGMNGHIRKPFVREDLLGRVQDAIEAFRHNR